MNKKGADPESVMYTIVVLTAIGMIIFLLSHLFSAFYGQVDSYFDRTPQFNNTGAHETLNDIQTVESTAWDYGFLAIFIGYLIILGFTAFATSISPFFFWIYSIFALIGLFLGTILSNTWGEMVEQPIFADTVARFPIMNTILGEGYPIVVTVIVVFSMILLFGKPFSGGNR